MKSLLNKKAMKMRTAKQVNEIINAVAAGQ